MNQIHGMFMYGLQINNDSQYLVFRHDLPPRRVVLIDTVADTGPGMLGGYPALFRCFLVT